MTDPMHTIDIESTEAAPIPTPTTALARVPVQSSLSRDQRYMNRLPDQARQFAFSSMCPDTWRVITKPEKQWRNGREVTVQPDTGDEIERKVGELAIVGESLADLDIRLSLNVLPQVYVVHGRPGYMAQLQVMLAARFGVPLVPLDDESDETRAVVKIVGKDRKWHRVTVTIEQAKKAKWPTRNPNYETMPDRMLMARACTKAIGLHCPEAKLMLPPADREELVLDMPDDDFETGELVRIANGKGAVLEAVMRAYPALDRQAAATTAGILWSSHQLPSGDGMMPRSQLDDLLEKIPSAPEQPAQQSQPEPLQQAEPRPEGAREPRDGPTPPAASEADERVPERIRDGQPEAAGQLDYGPDEEPF